MDATKTTELQAFFDEVYRPLRLRGRSENTSRLNGCTLRAFGRFLSRQPCLRALRELVLARYLEHRAAASGNAVGMRYHSSPKITKRWYLDPRLTDHGSKPCDILSPIAPGKGAAAR